MPFWHCPILVQVLVCCALLGQIVGDNTDVQLFSVHNGVELQLWLKTGLPPEQFAGKDDVIVLVCWLLTQVLQFE